MDPTRLGLHELAAAAREGRLAPEEILESFLDRIRRRDGALHAFLEIGEAAARGRARALASLPASSRGPLFGVPVALKDNILMAGAPAECASRALAGFRAPYSAAAVERLLAAGAIPFGRTNMDEFAMGSSTENSAFGPTRNPWALDRAPGGSSGGSAAAVAARLAPAALGSDTGGSIRQPAALCGVTGLKPTYGRVPRHGLVAFGSSLDQIGPIARSAREAALLLGVLAGPDPRDATSRPEPLAPGLSDLRGRAKGVRIGLAREHLGAGVEQPVRDGILEALGALEGLGARIRDVEPRLEEFAIPAYYLLATSEASSNLARYDGVHYGARAGAEEGLLGLYERSREAGFGPEVKRRILLGTFCLSAGYADAWYKQALQARTLITLDFERIFTEVDLVIGPTAPHTAFRLGEKTADPLEMYLCDALTVSASLAGLPALSIPCGADRSGLPIGLQITGPQLSEERILALAAAYQEVTPHHLREPNP